MDAFAVAALMVPLVAFLLLVFVAFRKIRRREPASGSGRDFGDGGWPGGTREPLRPLVPAGHGAATAPKPSADEIVEAIGGRTGVGLLDPPDSSVA
jgi:hypothetical protein